MIFSGWYWGSPNKVDTHKRQIEYTNRQRRHSAPGYVSSYWRKPKGLVCAWFIRIRRWRRQVCRRTVSCLPNFLLSFRHYLISVIQPVLSLWLEQGWSWSEVVVRCSQDGLPALRTGVPRQINRVCTTVLLAGMIDEATIRQVIADMNRS